MPAAKQWPPQVIYIVAAENITTGKRDVLAGCVFKAEARALKSDALQTIRSQPDKGRVDIHEYRLVPKERAKATPEATPIARAVAKRLRSKGIKASASKGVISVTVPVPKKRGGKKKAGSR